MTSSDTCTVCGKDRVNECACVDRELEPMLKGVESDDGHRKDGSAVGDHPADGADRRTGSGGTAGAGGAGEGPRLEPLVGEIEGYRVFWMRGDELHPLAVGRAWTPGTNTATCSFAGARRERARKAKTTTWVNDGDQLKEITVEATYLGGARVYARPAK